MPDDASEPNLTPCNCFYSLKGPPHPYSPVAVNPDGRSIDFAMHFEPDAAAALFGRTADVEFYTDDGRKVGTIRGALVRCTDSGEAQILGGTWIPE